MSPRHHSCRNSRIRFSTGHRGNPALYDAVYPLLLVALLDRFNKAKELLKDHKELAKFEAELENMKNRERSLFDLYSDGLATEKQLRDMLSRHKSKREVLERRILELKNSTITEDNLHDLQETLLNDLYTQLVTKSLPDNVYEALVNEADLSATVYRDRVEFHTKYGEVTISRLLQQSGNWMPEWDITIEKSGKNFNENTRFFVTYKTGKEEVLADFGQLQISSI